jgi:hypothetical protein
MSLNSTSTTRIFRSVIKAQLRACSVVGLFLELQIRPILIGELDQVTVLLHAEGRSIAKISFYFNLWWYGMIALNRIW